MSSSGPPIFVNYGKLTHKPTYKPVSNVWETVQNAVGSTYSMCYCIYVRKSVLWLYYIAYNPPTQSKSAIVSKIYDRRIYPGEHLRHNSRSLLSIDCRYHSVIASNILANTEGSVHYKNSYSYKID